MEPKRMLFVKSQRILGSLSFLKERSHARLDFASPVPNSHGLGMKAFHGTEFVWTWRIDDKSQAARIRHQSGRNES